MKVIINEVPTPMFESFTMFAKPDVKKLIETRTITVIATNKTKTRVSTSFKLGECSMRINWKVDGFKQFNKSEYEMFDHNKVSSDYFVKSKKQDFESYKLYVTELMIKLMSQLNVNLPELNVRLINRNVF